VTDVNPIPSTVSAPPQRQWPDPGEPTITRKERRVSFEWLVKENGRDGDARRHLACLSVTHQRAGSNILSGGQHANRYIAVLRRETETRASYGGVLRGFALFAGFEILDRDAGRFSPKQFECFAEDAIAKLFEMYAAGNERALSYFEPEQASGA
jgi:hypothetical protein